LQRNFLIPSSGNETHSRQPRIGSCLVAMELNEKDYHFG
jgi:hypothetical protein